MDPSTRFDRPAPRAGRPRSTARRSHTLLHVVVLVLLGAVLLAAAQAAVRDRTPEGIAFVEGGIGADEVSVLMAERPSHALSIRLAAQRSGAYLADVHLRIRDAAHRVVFERDVQAPWLFVDLPPGRYEIEGVHGANTQRRAVTVVAHGHREAVLHFPVEGQTAPHRPSDD